MQTTLNLLTRDGLLYMAFSPHLSPEQYSELLKLSEEASNRDELKQLVQEWAVSKGLRMTFDEARSLSGS